MKAYSVTPQPTVQFDSTPIDLRNASCQASSELDEEHSCEKAFDGSVKTSFASKGQGVGLWIKVTFPKTAKVSRVIINGKRSSGKG